jgi:hypothetical protein
MIGLDETLWNSILQEESINRHALVAQPSREAIQLISYKQRSLPYSLMQRPKPPAQKQFQSVSFKCFAELECASFVIRFPFAYFLAVFVSALVPKLTVVVVTSPRADLLPHLKSTCLEWFSVLSQPSPATIKFSVYVSARGLCPAVPVVKLPFAVPFTVLHLAFTGNTSVGKKLLLRTIRRGLSSGFHK